MLLNKNLKTKLPNCLLKFYNLTNKHSRILLYNVFKRFLKLMFTLLHTFFSLFSFK